MHTSLTQITPSFIPMRGKYNVFQSLQGICASFFEISQNPKIWNTIKSCVFHSLPSIVYGLYYFKYISPYSYYIICIGLNTYDFAIIWIPIIVAYWNGDKIAVRAQLFAIMDSAIIGISSLSAAAEVPKWRKRYSLFAGIYRFQTPITILFLSYSFAKPLAIT